jgi:hypothetical protein
MTSRGFVFNNGSISVDGATTAVLYEASPQALAQSLPRLVPTWDEPGWREAGCIDFWVYYRHADRALDVHLDWWSLERLADFTGDRALAAAGLEALNGRGTLDERLHAIGALVASAFAGAATPADR